MSDLLSTEAAAAALGMSSSRLRRLIRAGRIPAQAVGRAWVLRATDVAAFCRRPRGWPKGKARGVTPPPSGEGS